MANPDESAENPAHLRFLRRLVTVLTATMIGGLLVIIALIVIRFSASTPILPDQIVLPAGKTATAFTQGPSWYAVVTSENEVLIFNRSTGEITQTIAITLE